MPLIIKQGVPSAHSHKYIVFPVILFVPRLISFTVVIVHFPFSGGRHPYLVKPHKGGQEGLDFILSLVYNGYTVFGITRFGFLLDRVFLFFGGSLDFYADY